MEERQSELDEAEAASQAHSWLLTHQHAALHATAAFARAASLYPRDLRPHVSTASIA